MEANHSCIVKIKMKDGSKIEVIGDVISVIPQDNVNDIIVEVKDCISAYGYNRTFVGHLNDIEYMFKTVIKKGKWNVDK